MDSYNDLKTLIEAGIDKYGVERTLNALAEICFEKANHIASSYQDKRLAQAWKRDGDRINKLAELLASE